MTDIATAMGEAYYGCPDELKKECESRIENDMMNVLKRFTKTIQR